MTKNLALLLALLGMLAACGEGTGSNPVVDTGDEVTDPDPGDDDDDDDDGGIEGDDDLPPGTSSPSAKKGITRYEEYDLDSGNGFATNVSYDAATDTFAVNNLGFDGSADTPYTRGAAVGSLGPYAVYEAVNTVPDAATGTVIDQFAHKAIYGVSKTGKTRFAVIRTGAYVPYGYGGFIYERDGKVTLPTSGQAAYAGDYAALRDFEGKGGIEYATGDMTVDIDFDDFDNGGAVKGYVTNRVVFDDAGNDITQDVVDALNAENGTSVTNIPTLIFKVGPGHLDANGEVSGEINSWKPGSAEAFEEGNYYAVLSGDGAEELVGVIVVEGDDARYDDVTVRETGGFILSR